MNLRLAATLAILVLATPVLLAGCARPSDRNPYDVALDKGTGGISVIVQDDAQQRVANATVLLTPSGIEGRTDSLGMFVARDLDPGQGTAYVNAPSHYDAHTDFTVVADQYNEVVVFLDRTSNR